MLRIGDFSKLTHVSVRMLRYYENQGLLMPCYRDPVTGYRMYSAKQVPLLQKIVMLRELSFGVGETKELLYNWNDSYLIRRLGEKIQDMEKMIELEKQRIEQIRLAVTQIQCNELNQYCNVTVKSVPSYPVISLRKKVENYYEEGQLWKELMDFVSREHIEYDKSRQNGIAIYHDEEYSDSGIDMEVCLIVRRLEKSRGVFTCRTLEPVPKMAGMMVYGPYENLAGAYLSFAGWLDENQPCAMGAPTRQITIIDHQDTDNPEEYLTEIQIPLMEL
ncbi:MerR family transcriptional regulator [Lacrimispora sp. 38-1]|uniref:MerR family transcriptional regulator n=1 Tax=Lacrimispora sp. 38-1 TaxID=3125778 RepID=UPI003CF678A9